MGVDMAEIKQRKSGLTPLKDIHIIRMVRESKEHINLITANLPKKCFLRSRMFMAIIIIAEIAEETRQDIIADWQICKACKITGCPHKK